MRKLFFFILPSLFFMVSACKNDENPPPVPKEDQEEEKALIQVTSMGISTTGFVKAHEAIVHEGMLYVIEADSTYRYDFFKQSWTAESKNIGINFNIPVSNLPYFKSNLSFIRDGKWYILNFRSLWYYDFDKKLWILDKLLKKEEYIPSPEGFYENGTLHVFSDMGGSIFTYDFEKKEFNPQGALSKKTNYDKLVKSTFKVGDRYIYARLVNEGRTIVFYELRDNFNSVVKLNEYETDYLGQGVGYVFQDKIIFGLGGQVSPDDNDGIKYSISDRFAYYDVTKDEFGEVDGKFTEGTYVGIPFTYGNRYFLLHGQTVRDNQIVLKNSMEEITFSEQE